EDERPVRGYRPARASRQCWRRKKRGWGMAARISRRRVLALGAGALLGAPAVIGAARAQGRTVYVNSYGGVWESSWRKAFFEPFTAQTGVQINTLPALSFSHPHAP